MPTLTKAELKELRTLTRSLMDTYGDPGTLNFEDILAAELMNDLDRMRTYAKLLPEYGCNTARINLILGFYKRQGIAEVSTFITSEQLLTLINVGFAISTATGLAPETLDSPVHDQLMMESLNHLGRMDDMVEIIATRKITDLDQFKEMISDIESSHQSLRKGNL